MYYISFEFIFRTCNVLCSSLTMTMSTRDIHHLLVLRDDLRLLVVGWLHVKRFPSSHDPRAVDDDGQGVPAALPRLQGPGAWHTRL